MPTGNGRSKNAHLSRIELVKTQAAFLLFLLFIPSLQETCWIFSPTASTSFHPSVCWTTYHSEDISKTVLYESSTGVLIQSSGPLAVIMCLQLHLYNMCVSVYEYIYLHLSFSGKQWGLTLQRQVSANLRNILNKDGY